MDPKKLELDYQEEQKKELLTENDFLFSKGVINSYIHDKNMTRIIVEHKQIVVTILSSKF
jgi:hypothetical protein